MTRDVAIRLLNESYKMNPGPWKNHSLVVAECAYKIAKLCSKLDEDKAYNYGLLHDIGRRFGVTYLRHTIDGYDYCVSLGYIDIARICLTHSFAEKDIEAYIGDHDVTKDEKGRITLLLDSFEFNDYDRLIQLCDSLAMPDGPVDIITRMNDVKNRYGYYPETKWNKHIEIQEYFEKKIGKSIDSIVKN
jgi:hypothetical protein